MSNVRLVALNAAGGAIVTISSSIPARRCEIIEDGSIAVPTGLIFTSMKDNFTTTFQVAPQTEPVILGNPTGQGGAIGALLGIPAQNSAGAFNFHTADPLLKATSATAATTKVRVTEDE
jgi:hypothetical protein